MVTGDRLPALPADVVPLAFPETIIARDADVSVLAGYFDDPGLTRLVHRVALLGGRVLAVFDADPTAFNADRAR